MSSQEALTSALQEHLAALVYFSSPTCNVCQVLRPKIMESLEMHYPNIARLHVDLSITPEIGAQYNVLAAPTVIVFLEGKEFIRKYRTFSVDGLLAEIKRPYDMMMS
ncbi:MAG: thioredoxin [Sulfurovum sp. PC08-66]|nr:MAG: thioredoxin [Sulfurovum sp. PC08-66]KIM12517.1 MAG: thioredoxin [Sulfuricurvum sp. PC08-66]